jgi:hypothetical protein
MNRAERLALVDHDDPVLPVTAQCGLLKVARSTLYYQPVPAGSDELAVMRRIDELHLEYPFYGSRRMAVVLRTYPKVTGGFRSGVHSSEQHSVAALKSIRPFRGKPRRRL